LYLRPLKTTTQKTWYADTPVGVHLLQKTVGKLCSQAGFEGHFTNHSLRATAATRLYEAGIDEQLITEKTGHRSSAVRSYKRTNDTQLQDISKIIHGNVKSGKNAEEKQVKTRGTGDSIGEIKISSGNVSFQFKF
jgi:integrase